MFEGPLHPKLVHFPIALLITALLLDILSRMFKRESWYHAAITLFVVAAFSSLAALFSGLWEEDRLHLEHPLLEKHELAAFCTVAITWLGMLMLFLTRKHLLLRRTMITFVLLIAVIAVVVTAHWGGEMVYEYGVGVAG